MQVGRDRKVCRQVQIGRYVGRQRQGGTERQWVAQWWKLKMHRPNEKSNKNNNSSNSQVFGLQPRTKMCKRVTIDQTQQAALPIPQVYATFHCDSVFRRILLLLLLLWVHIFCPNLSIGTHLLTQILLHKDCITCWGNLLFTSRGQYIKGKQYQSIKI